MLDPTNGTFVYPNNLAYIRSAVFLWEALTNKIPDKRVQLEEVGALGPSLDDDKIKRAKRAERLRDLVKSEATAEIVCDLDFRLGLHRLSHEAKDRLFSIL